MLQTLLATRGRAIAMLCNKKLHLLQKVQVYMQVLAAELDKTEAE